MTWSGEKRAFLVGSFIQTGCVAATIRKFRTQYNIQPKGAVPNYRTILHWVELFKKKRINNIASKVQSQAKKGSDTREH